MKAGTTIQTSGTDEAGVPVFRSVLLSGCTTPFAGTSGVTASDVQTIFNAGSNNNANFTSTLTNTFINGTGETAATAVDPATAVDSGGFFTSAPYVGAVRNASDTWYRNWTCNSATADFGSAGGACSTLPTT